MPENPAYQRMMSATGATSGMALAKVLGVTQSSVWDAQKRGAIPPGWLVALVEQFGISPRWIKTGEGPERLYDSSARSLAEVPLPELMAELGRRQEIVIRAASGVTSGGKE